MKLAEDVGAAPHVDPAAEQVAELVAADAAADAAECRTESSTESHTEVHTEPRAASAPVADESAAPATRQAAMRAAPVMRMAPAEETPEEELPEVIELDGTGSEAIIDAILVGHRGLRPTDIPTPGRVPCRVAVGPEGRLVLLCCPAAEEVEHVGTLLSWAADNLLLIARATLGATVDVSLAPRLHLYVAGKTAAGLARLVDAASITVHTYQPVRWGGRRGLLLDAA
jgi:hypothetical protein